MNDVDKTALLISAMFMTAFRHFTFASIHKIIHEIEDVFCCFIIELF